MAHIPRFPPLEEPAGHDIHLGRKKIQMSSESTPKPEPEPVGQTSRPLFKMIGCATVLILTLAVGLLIALWMVTSGGLPREPLPMPPIETVADPVEIPQEWYRGEIEVTADSDSWNLTIQRWVEEGIESGKLAVGSGFHCLSAPDGSLSLRVSLGIPEDAQDQDYLKRGRFLNFTMTGEFLILNTVVESVRLDEYSWGFIYTQQPGEVIEEEAAKNIVDRILQQVGELGFLPLEIENLTHSPGGVTLKLSPRQ